MPQSYAQRTCQFTYTIKFPCPQEQTNKYILVQIFKSSKFLIWLASLCEGCKDVWKERVENIWTEELEVAEDFRKITTSFAICYI